MTSSNKKNWTFGKGMMVLLLSFLIFSIGAIMLINFQHYDNAVKIIGGIWGAFSAIAVRFGIKTKARKKRALSECLELWWIKLVIIVWTIVSALFLIRIALPVHLVILTTNLQDNARDSVTVKWDGYYKGYTDKKGKLQFCSTIGPHRLSYERTGFKEKLEDVDIPILLIPPLKIPLVFVPDDRITGHLYVSSRPAGAEILINGKSQGKTTNNYVFDYPVGRWQIELKKSGYHTKICTVEVKEGKTAQVSEKLHILTGSLNISDASGAYIYLNGKCLQNKRTPQNIVLPIGKYVLELRKIEGKYGYRWEKSVEITVNTTLLIDIELDNKKFQNQYIEQLHDLYIMSDPSAKIFIDGKLEGMTNSVQVYLFAGQHNVTLKQNGYDDYSFPVKVPDMYVLSDTIKLQARTKK